MIQFILTTVLMVSLGTILYLVARSLPRIEEEQPADGTLLERWAASEIPEKVDAAFNGFLMKFLRKLKVVLLKIDNYLTDHLKKISSSANGGGNDKPKIDFKDINGSEPNVADIPVGVEKTPESGDN